MSLVMELLTSIRSIRSQLNIPYTVSIAVHILCSDKESVQKLLNHGDWLRKLGRVGHLQISTDMKRPPRSAVGVLPSAKVFVPLDGIVDMENEKARLKKEQEKVAKDIKFMDKKFANDNFVKNAPQEVLDKDKNRYAELKKIVAGLESSLSWLDS